MLKRLIAIQGEFHMVTRGVWTVVVMTWTGMTLMLMARMICSIRLMISWSARLLGHVVTPKRRATHSRKVVN